MYMYKKREKKSFKCIFWNLFRCSNMTLSTIHFADC